MHRCLAKLGRHLRSSSLHHLLKLSSDSLCTHLYSPIRSMNSSVALVPIIPFDLRQHSLPFSPVRFVQHREFASKKEKKRSRAPITPVKSKVKKYKIKAYSSFKLRFRTTSDGLIRRGRAGKRHNAHLKSKKAKRRLRKPGIVHAAYAKGRTVKVSNVSHSATEQDIEEFFSFSGDIAHVEIKSFDEWSRVAYVTFRDLQGAETAVLLSGATIVDQAVIITIAADYQPPRSISLLPTYEDCRPADGPQSAIQKAGIAVSTVLARGYVMGRNTAGKAKSFNEKHRITSTAAARVVSLDRKIGLSEKIGAGASAVGGKVAEVDRRFRVSGRTKAAISAAEQKVFIGVSMVAGAFSKVGQAAGEVGSKTRAKALVEQLKRGTF